MISSTENDSSSFLVKNHATLSQHLFWMLQSFLNVSTETKTKLETIEKLLFFLKQTDAHLDLCHGARGFLPELDWNGRFRKSYSLFLWVRPVICTNKNCSCHGGENEDEDQDSQETKTKRRILYRFATSPQDSNGLGVCATLGEWSFVEKTGEFQSTLTAFSLPHSSISHETVAIPSSSSLETAIYSSTFVACTLRLKQEEWSLISISHIFPYLKRPQWTIAVNGETMGSGELAFPVLEKQTMAHNTLLEHAMDGGALVIQNKQQDQDDSATPASSLQEVPKERVSCHLHLASVALYEDAVMDPALLQIVSDAGPMLSLQQEGRALPLVPPVSNYSKGSGLDGPTVGIPLLRNLEIQKLASRVCLGYSSASVLILRNPHRIVMPTSVLRGETESTPKVGLFEPTLRNDLEAPLVWEGKVQAVHMLAEFLLNSDTMVTHDLHAEAQLFSLLLYEQSALSAFVLPFFLSLPPPAHALELQRVLQSESIQHLRGLYQQDGEYASALIGMLTTAIRYGGARVMEEVLQAGLLHIFSDTLRRSLVRACREGVFDGVVTVGNDNNNNNNDKECPRYIPNSIAEACAQLIHTCCGGSEIRRVSDLAMTAVFGLALDMDLWGNSIQSAAMIFKAVADHYAKDATVLRNQVPVQYLLDSIKLRFDNVTVTKENHEALDQVGQSLGRILFAMLLASLLNRKLISQGEHDVSACMGALSGLGSMGGHVVLSALCSLLRWCDILPEPRKSLLDQDDSLSNPEEALKTQVASRLGRNLLIGQYHDVVAPMLLSRTIFCGDHQLLEKEMGWKRDWRMALLVFSWVTSISGAEGEVAAKSTGSLLLASALAGSLKGCLVSNSRLVSCLFLPPPVMALSIGASGRRSDKSSWSYSDLLADRLRVMMPLLPGLVASLVSHPEDSNAEEPMDTASLSVLTELIAAVGGAFHRVYGGLNQASMVRKSRMMRRSRRSAASAQAVKAAKDYVPHLLVVVMLLENHIAARRPTEVSNEIEILSCVAETKKSRSRTNSETEWVDVSSSLADSSHSYSVAYKMDLDSSTSSIQFNNSDNDATLAKLSSCQNIVFNCLTDLIANAMKHGGGEASTTVWRSVISTLNESLAYSKKATPKQVTDNSQSKSEVAPDSAGAKNANANPQALAQDMLCRLAALVLTKAVTRENDADIMWSVDLCSAVSRLCDLVEEKELLRTPNSVTTEETVTAPYSRDQVLLFCALLDIMAFGREVTGWCQLVLHPAPQKNEIIEASNSEQSDEMLPSPLLSPMKEQVADLVDGVIMQPGYDLYHRVTDDGSEISSPITPRTGIRTQSDPTPGATSKLLLPILQPSLRVVLGCVGNIRSTVVIAVPQPAVSSPTDDDSEDPEKHTAKMSLLSHTGNELRHTLTAAIVGLSFSNARDVALNTMASLRRGLIYHRNAQDEDAVKICCFLFVTIAEEIRVRYDAERRLRDKALFDAYEDEQGGTGDEQTKKEATERPSAATSRSSGTQEAESSRAVEQLILGGDLIPSKRAVDKQSPNDDYHTITFEHGATEEEAGNAAPQTPSTKRRLLGGGNEDFIMFHETFASPEDVVGKDGTVTKMSWSHYKGMGKALEKCAEVGKAKASEGHEVQVESMMSVLTSYLDTWDESVARDAAESELVELFNESVTIDEIEKVLAPPLPLSPLGTKVQAALNSSAPSLPIVASETAADAMTNFIEFSSVEKSRLKEVATTYLPARRSSCVAFTERYCWAQYMEFVRDDADGSMNELWERSTADGNRDVRSRLITMPCNPQFKRFIPAWLDHGTSVSSLPVSEGESQTEGDEAEKGRGNSMLSRDGDIDLSEAKKLVEAGDLEIVDITKKEIEEEDNEEMLLDVTSDDLDDVDVSERPNYFEDEVTGHTETGPSKTDESYDNDRAGDEKNPAVDSTSFDAKVESAKAKDTSEQEATIAELIDQVPLRSFHHHITSSPFSHPPDNSSATISLIHSSAAGMIEFHFDNCLHVKTEGSRKCSVLLSATHLILEYDAESEGLYDGEMMAVREEAERQKMIEESRVGPGDTTEGENATEAEIEKRHRESAALRPKCIRFNISELSHVYLRRYRLRDSALEMFFIPSGGSSFGGFGLYAPATSLFLDFGPGYEGNVKRDDAANAIMRRAPPQTIKQWPDRSGQFLHEQLSRLAMGWVEGRITNFDYLLHLNILSGRSYNDLCQYPVMPWVLSNFYSKDLPDLSDRSNFRDLSKPMGALNPDRLQDFIDRFETFSDPTIPPFMYGSHYSTSAGVVLHFLVRMHPFAGLHRQLQGGHFDVADRLFSSVPRTWDMCTGSSAAEVKELTPEWYCNPAFLKNANKFKLGTSQEGELIADVTLPPWANGSPEKFVEVMRDALESDICSEMLPDWIDLIFGRKQQGPEAIKAHNVFFYLTYYGSVDVASIEDESLRTATELQIAHFGQCPMQLFRRPHVRRVQRWRNFRRLTFYQMLSAYTHGAGPKTNGSEIDDGDELKTPILRKDGQQRLIGEPLFLPFFSAPISHWVHLAAPPPGPHADLIAVRLAGLDRCLAVDAQGIFHSFRWAWKPEDGPPGEEGVENREEKYLRDNLHSSPIDKGGFVAQRELPRFRMVPRLPHIPMKRSGDGRSTLPAVGISKTLFAGRSVLLVLSDGDGRGAVAMQLVDPAKGTVRGEAVVPSVHSSRITCIAMDPIGTAAGHGGVGGELAILGSADGGTSVWRFMSSHYLPLRPRVRMRGHGGAKVHAVALSSSIHVCASVSENRCCIFSVGNGGMIRSFPPPQDTLHGAYFSDENTKLQTVFADTPALCLSVQGFLVCVCKTTVSSTQSPKADRSIVTLHLFSLEGVSLGSKALESWRGIPHKICSTPDGTAIFVCSGRGITIHRLSAVTPLEFIDEWHITENEELDENVPTAWDVDFGPSILRPVVGAAACSSGTLRLHALPGISSWSERHKKSSMTAAMGQALAKPAQRIKKVMGKGLGFGSKFVGMGKEIGKEVSSDVKERGVGGFLGGVIFRKNSQGG